MCNQISESHTTSAKRSSQVPTRKPSAKRIRSKSFDDDRLIADPSKRRLLRFSSLGIGRPLEASHPYHHQEIGVYPCAHDRQPNSEHSEISPRPLHHGPIRHTVPVTLIPHKQLIPISKLSLSSKDYTYLQSLAPLAFYREERYNWGHVKLTNLRARSRFPSLKMTSQVPSVPQDPTRRRADHKSISNKTASKGRSKASTRLNKHPVILPKSVCSRRPGLVLMRCPKPLRFIGDSNVEGSQLGAGDSLSRGQSAVTPSLTRPPVIKHDQMLATSTASPVQVTSPVNFADISTGIEQQVGKDTEQPNTRNSVNVLSVSIPSSNDIPLAGHVDSQVKKSLQSTSRHVSEILTHKNAAESSLEEIQSPLSDVTSNQSLVTQSVPKHSKLNHTQSYFGQLLHCLSDVSSVRQFFSNQRTSTSNVATRWTGPPETKSTMIKPQMNATIAAEECRKIVHPEPNDSLRSERSPLLENFRPNVKLDPAFVIPEVPPIAEENEIRDTNIFSGSEASGDNVHGVTTYITPDTRVQIYDEEFESVAETQSSNSSLISNRLPVLDPPTRDSPTSQPRRKAPEKDDKSLMPSHPSVSSSSEEESKIPLISILAPETPPITPDQCASTPQLMTKAPDLDTSMWSSLGMKSDSITPFGGITKIVGRLAGHKSFSIPSRSVSTISKHSIRPHPFLGKCQIRDKNLQHSPKFKICINGLGSSKRKGRLIGNIPSYFAGQHY